MEMNQLCLLQSAAGYRYSMDSFILADFVSQAEENKIIDFGTGNGIIPFLLSRKTESKIAGLDIQYSLLQHARSNIAQNRLENQIMLIQGDIRFSKYFLKNRYFDIVVSNPPYRKLNSGRLNPNEEKAIARHEILITLPELVENAANLLRDEGKLVMIYLPERYDELVRIMAEDGITPKRIRFVHSNKKSKPKIFLIEGVKKEDLPLNPSLARRGSGVVNKKSPLKTEHFQKGKTKILDPLYIYDNDGNYTLEMQKIYDSFNYNRGTNSNRKI